MSWKEPALRACEDGEVLLQDVADQESSEHDEYSNGISRLPLPLPTRHSESKQEGDPHARPQNKPDPVDARQPIADANIGHGMDSGKVEEEARGDDGADTQVDVEGPAPGGGGDGEGAADDGAQDRAPAPGDADQRHVQAALLVRRQPGEVLQRAQVDARAAGAGDDAAHDQGVHGGRGAAHGRADLEEQRGGDEGPFEVEAFVQLSEQQDDAYGSQWKAGADYAVTPVSWYT